MKEWLTALLLSALAVLAPIKPILITLILLVFMDTVTGTYAAYKRKEKITSALWSRIASKLFVYLGAVICGWALELNILDHLIPVAKLAAGAIGLIEFKSILENSNSIMGMDIFQSLITKLSSQNAQGNDSDKKE